ncbi:DUF5615 family PIN-like protein [Deinococcus sp.]|uniref:DUF5615 family PIN-like protein n=1 Tax=Deinococcus sp. TaxID=47478 RepID=UPI003C7AFEF0
MKAAFQATWTVVHTSDLGTSLDDLELWQYARKHRLVIVTKDADFSDRVMNIDVSPP